MTGLRLTDYHFALPGTALPPADESLLLEYIVGKGGTYARGRRPGLEVCMPVSFNLQPIRGLSDVASYAQWGYPLVPDYLLNAMVAVCRAVCATQPKEALFYLTFSRFFNDEITCQKILGHLACGGGWHVTMPEQEATESRVIARDRSAGAEALIELHSHHQMRAEFSLDDNQDESQGFRVYAVIGEIFTRPRIRTRVGLFGHFCDYRAAEFFQLPEAISDEVLG